MKNDKSKYSYKKPLKVIHFADGVPEGWDKELWKNVSEKLEQMTKEEILKAYSDFGIVFSNPSISKDELIGVADEIIPEDARKYFNLK